MKKLLIAVLTLVMGVSAASAQESGTAPIDSVSEAVGTMFGTYVRRSLNDLGLMGVGIERQQFLNALMRAIDGEPGPMDVTEADTFMQRHIDRLRERMTRVDTVSSAVQAAFVDSLAETEGAVCTPDGTVLIVITEGEGNPPAVGDTVRVMYTGRLSDGTQFDATDSPITFRVGDLVEGFNQGIEMMKPGGRYRLVIPAEAAYGTEGIPGIIPGNSALDFTVDLISIKPKE